MKDFQLLESILWRPGRGFFLLRRHWLRLRRDAAFFGFPLDLSPITLRRRLDEAVTAAGATVSLKLRLLVDNAGRMTVTATPLPPAAGRIWRIAPALTPVDAANPFLRYKTTHRIVYDRARAETPGYDDVLLWNQRGEVTETSVANVLFDFGDGQWITPPVACGLLPGVYRAYLLNARRIREAVVRLYDVACLQPRILLINSVRRRIPAVLEG